MHDRLRVRVTATDPVSLAGCAAVLRLHHDFDVRPWPHDPAKPTPAIASRELAGPALPIDDGGPDVHVVCAEDVDVTTLLQVRVAARDHAPVVLLVSDVDDAGVHAAVSAGTTSLLRRSQATAERLGEVVRLAVQGVSTLPQDVSELKAAVPERPEATEPGGSWVRMPSQRRSADETAGTQLP